jgi:hypothetical protein
MQLTDLLHNHSPTQPGIAKSAAVATAKMATFGGLDIEKEYEKVAANLVGGAVNNLVDSFNVQSSAIYVGRQRSNSSTNINKFFCSSPSADIVSSTFCLN